ncbi:Snf7-domain-containing protein [Morchella snyderi]|nr:Snf7-domain-containing protein [Morchella snyderi]
MESIKAMIWGPDPTVQLRKCNQLIRKNTRELDRHIQQLRSLESKTKAQILTTSKSRSRNSAAETRIIARELVRIRRQSSRLVTSKAQLQSVGMQVREAFSVRKIEGSIRTSTGVMRNVNSLVRLPELTGTMRELSMELVKAGIIEEMVADSLPDDAEMEDDEVEEEVEKALKEVMGGTVVVAPAAPVSPEKGVEEEEDQDTLDDMRERLEMLKS